MEDFAKKAEKKEQEVEKRLLEGLGVPHFDIELNWFIKIKRKSRKNADVKYGAHVRWRQEEVHPSRREADLVRYKIH